MAKQLNVNLSFTADTSKAKAQLQDLNNQLLKVMNQPTTGLGASMANDIAQASRAAAELKVHLDSAMNPKTGSLDFSKLNQSLQKSGVSLTTYANKLKQIGPEGEKAFAMLAQSIARSEVPIRRTNALLSELWITMKNTARWQLSSSVLHGFIGAVQSAFGYAKDLNKSLNDIRIVTGQNADQMARFADQANRAAKALSTTTNAYAKAALIYYQQGDSDAEVLQKTDVTTKMANVTGQSADVVSDQLTAIWNNFNKSGEEAYEKYADVLTALGAATASSTDEIAGGLEKFASIADMIGLSYEYAATALATITATTRQSEDVVGTALKTIFARIQGLNLGDTLEDGTTLNKYSAALEKVGISIFDASGQLKKMDSILDEMGDKWKTLSKDQQVALAQTVAGVRQYNQLVSLMDNWDTFGENLNIAKNSEGELNRQQEIYEESWKAASDRVRASLEAIYDALINDDFFIGFLNNVSKLINLLDKVIDSAGGLKGTLSAIAVIIGKIKFDSITAGLQSMAYNVRNFFDGGKAVRQEKLTQLQQMIQTPGDRESGELTTVESTTNTVIEAQIKSQQYLIDNVKSLSVEEQKVLKLLMDQQAARSQQAITAAEMAQKAADEFGDADIMARSYAGVSTEDRVVGKGKKKQTVWGLKTIKEKATTIGEELGSNGNKYNDDLAQRQKELDRQVEALIKTEKLTKEEAAAVRKYASAAREKARTNKVLTQTTEEATKEINKKSIAEEQERQKTEAATRADQLHNKEKELGIKLTQQSTQKMKLSAAGFVSGGMAALSMVSAVSMLSSAFSALENPDLSDWEKFSSIAMSLTMVIPMLTTSFKQLTNAEIMVASASGAMEAKTLGTLAANSKLGQGVVALVKNLTKGKVALTGASAGLASVAVYAAIAIAAIAALVAIIKECVDAWNDDANAVKGAQETVKQATEAFNEAKTSLDNLSESLKQYETLQNAFDGLTKGTKEWNEALVKSNAHISEMLRTYPELAQYFVNDNGKFSFSDTETVKDLYENRLVSAETALNTSQIALNVAENRSMKTNALRDKDIADTFNGLDFANEVSEWALNGAVTGMAMGAMGGPFAAITSTVGLVGGTLIGAVYGLLDATVDNTLAANESEQALDKLQAAYDKSGSIIFTSQQEFTNALDGISQDTIDALWNSRESLEKLARETNLNTAQMKALIESNVASRNAEDEDYKNLDDYDKSLAGTVVAARAAKALTDPNSKEYIKARGSAKSTIFNGAFGKDNYDEYLIARFGEDHTNYRVIDTWGDDATLQRKNEKGTWANVGEKNSLSNTEVLDYMTSYNLQKITEEDKAVIAKLQEVENVIRGAGDKFSNTQDDNSRILGLQKDLADGGLASLINFSPSEVEQIKASLNSIPEEYKAAMEAAVEAYSPEDYANNVVAQESAKIQEIFANAAEQLKMSEDSLESYAASLMEADGIALDFSETTADMTAEQAEARAEQAKLATLYAKASAAQFKLAKGLNKVQKAYEDNKDVLEENNEASLDFHEAVGELSEALTEAFGMEVDAGFVKNNLDLIKKAANGSEQALVDLRKQLNQDFVMSLDLKTEGAHEALISELERMSDLALNADIGAEITLNNETAIKALNEALYTGQATIQDIEAMFNNANLAMPEYKIEYMDGESVESTTETDFTGPLGLKWHTSSTSVTTSKRAVPYFGDNPPSVSEEGTVDYGGGGAVTTTSTGDLNQLDKIVDYEGDDGKKSGGKDYKPEIDRYHEITKEIEKQERALKRLQTAKERAYGATKLKLIDDEIAAIKDLKAAHEELARQQDEKLAEDAGKLLQLFPQADISNGYIANYNDLLMQTTSEEQKKILDQYEQTWEAWDATWDKVIEFDEQIQDLNYDKLSYSIEVKVVVDEGELALLELKLKELEDNFFKMAESAALMRNQDDIYESILGSYKTGYEDLTTLYNNKDIGQQQYIDGLTNMRDGMIDQLNALLDLDKEMLHFYENTLSEANDKLDDHTDHLEHITDTFDHYLNLMDILGKSKDYDAMGNFLQGKADTLRDQLDVQKEWVDVLVQQERDAKAALDAAMASGDEKAIEMMQNNWDAARDALDEAQGEMFELTEEWAEAMKAVIQNNMEKAAASLEAAMTGGTTFDTLLDGFDKLNTQQEEYLTNTNKIYEIKKMTRDIDKALASTDNKLAKQKLLAFKEETENLGEKTQLSKYELEVQQAKYDLLLAEIALEEAQNAKSTVRLTRDNEGNFGYVYTSDEEAVSQAEQGVDDAKNNLYNLSLQGQQEYTQKYLEAQKSFHEELTALDQAYINGEIASEEEYREKKFLILNHYLGLQREDYNAYETSMAELNRQWKDGEIATEEEFKAKQAEIMNQYMGEGGILRTYSDLYNIAVRTDADATEDNWQKNYGAMTQNTEAWKNNVNGYIGEVMTQTDAWKLVSEKANDDVGGALNDSETATRELKDESKLLRDYINDTLIPTLGSEIEEVRTLTTEYGLERDAISDLIDEYKEYIAIMNRAIATAAQVPENTGGGTKPTLPTPITPTTPSAGGNTGGKNTGGNNTDKGSTSEEEDSPPPKQPEPPKDVDPPFEVGDRVTVPKDRYGYKDYKKPNIFNRGKSAGNFDTVVESKVLYEGTNWYKVDDTLKNTGYWWFIGPNLMARYDTGGYTGDWGAEGKLAMLHQKELVLNAHDTENFLAGITILREITKAIEFNANSLSQGILGFAPGSVNTTEETLQQEVTIHAEFPNATDRNEIEEAFNTLVNRASQYANRKR